LKAKICASPAFLDHAVYSGSVFTEFDPIKFFGLIQPRALCVSNSISVLLCIKRK